jgi:hypothetical protein
MVISAGPVSRERLPAIEQANSVSRPRSPRVTARQPAKAYFAPDDDDEALWHQSSAVDLAEELSDSIEVGPIDDGSSEVWSAGAEADSNPRVHEPPLADLEDGRDPLNAEPWYDRPIDWWGRFQVFVAGAGGAASLAVLAFLFVLAATGRTALETPISILLVGLLGTVALLLIGLTTAALIILVLDLARNIRRLRIHAERSAGIERA